MPRLRDELAPGGQLAIVVRRWFESAAIWERLLPIYGRFGANPDFRPLDPIVELENRGLFARQGEHATDPSAWRPTVAEILGCLHSQNGFDPERMGAVAVAAFDSEIEGAFQSLVAEGVVTEDDGRFELEMRAVVVWGTPGG